MQALNTVMNVLSLSWFSHTVAVHFPHLHMASKLLLGVCDECLRLSEAKNKCSTEQEKAAYTQAKTIHLELQRAERIAYVKRKLLAETDPASYWNMIVDYTDT